MEASRLHLWEITDQLDAIGAELADNGGDLTPELEARLDALEGAWETKVERVALYVCEMLANAAAAKEEADRLEATHKRFACRADGLKGYLLKQLQRMGRQKVETSRVTIRTQKNGRPSIRWTRGVEQLPEFLRRTVVQVDGDAAYQQWKEGVTPLPDGFEVTLGQHLRIL